jgi:hypothetical protein
MKKIILFLLLFILFLPGGFSQQKDYSWPLPEHWVEEFIPFPLKFAPSIKYTGIEEVHFMPGWRGTDSLSGQRWSYMFTWYLDSVISINSEILKQDLTTYFDGLQRWVMKNSNLLVPLNVVTEITIQDLPSGKERKFNGAARICDVFFTGKTITLNLIITNSNTHPDGKTLLFFELSPEPFDHPVWKDLDRHRNEFRFIIPAGQ